MLDTLFLPLQIHSSPSYVLCVPGVCIVLTVSVTSLASGTISELKKIVELGYVFPTSQELSCCLSPLVICVPFLKATTCGLCISYPFMQLLFPISRNYYLLDSSELGLLIFLLLFLVLGNRNILY